MVEQSEGGDFPPKKSQSEPAAQPQQPADFQPKKLARQLDFTAGYSGGATSSAVPSSASSSTAMPTATVSGNHPQPPQAVLKSSQPLPEPQSIRPSQLTKPQLHPPLQLMAIQQPSVPPAVHTQIRSIKPESPRPRPKSNAGEGKDGTPKKQKQCNCKHSKCLKLYCECFASGIYCDGCNCVNCNNNVENEAARREAVESTLERNPNAFRPKIASSPHGIRDSRDDLGEGLIIGKHNKGCHCKKSGCLKKYCECFQANILCSNLCKCMDCKNFEGSEERQALFHGDHASNISYMQQAANAAITGAIGSSGYGSPPVNKKRKGQELFFGSTVKDSLTRMGQLPQPNHSKTAVPSSSASTIPGARLSNPAGMGASKFTYRSLFADIIQPRDLKELCSVLVVYSAEAAKIFADEKNAAERPLEEHRENHLPSTRGHLQNGKDCTVAEKASVDYCLNGRQSEKIVPDESSSDGPDASKGRPMSPGTLALMCDEQGTMFTSAASPTGVMGLGDVSSQMPPGEGLTEAYAEQERIVLTKFRDCLNKLITLGEIKELITHHSELTPCLQKQSARCLHEVNRLNQRDLMSNGNSSFKIESMNQPDSIPESAIPPPRTFQLVTAAIAAGGTATSPHLLKVPSSVENGPVKSITEKAL